MALMGIGEFARLSRLSPHALRRYDEMGLLPPRRVDPDSGYRWYAAEQLPVARLVAGLRQAGMPLARIKALLDVPTGIAATGLADWWSDTEADHAARRELVGFLIDQLNGKRSVMYEVKVRSVPSRNVLSLLRHVRWEEFPAVTREFMGRFTGMPRGEGAAGATFIVYHGEVTEDSDGPVEWCRPVADDVAAELAARFPDLVLRSETAHEEAYVHLARDPARTPPAQSLLVLETLLTWAGEQHRRVSGSVRQVFSQAPGTVRGPGLECDFAVPLATARPDDGALAPAVEVSAGFVPAVGADLYVERRGDGPPLLLITGGGGDCAFYSALADLLARWYTVLTYDRRGNSRSRLHGPAIPITLPSQADDAMAVLRAAGFSSAAVFGNGGGATIALELAARHPDVPTTVIAHEPPLPRLLAPDDQAVATFAEIFEVLDREGWQAALAMFLTRVGHLDEQERALLRDPESVLPAGPELDTLTRMIPNWEYLTRYEIRSFADYLPDTGRLTASGRRIVVAVGRDDVDQSARRIAHVLAGELGVKLTEFPGGHNAPVDDPGTFAVRLSEVLAG